MLEIDGAQGEGGGQILRTALSLSLCLGKPLRVRNIRAKRAKPGLLRQHLTALKGAVAISEGHALGGELGSQVLEFYPGPVRGGRYALAIGSAGSCTLVLQTLLPALLRAAQSTELVLSGGTHNPLAPTAHFLQGAFLPLLRRMGVVAELELTRFGFYPAGGGSLSITIQPTAELRPLHLKAEPGVPWQRRADCYLAAVPRHVAQRELETAGRLLQIDETQRFLHALDSTQGPGNVLHLTLQQGGLCEVFTGFGEKGVSAESVAKGAVREAREFLSSGAAVGPYLADQLLLPMALAGAGSFTASAITEHSRTHAAVLQQCLPVRIEMVKMQESAAVGELLERQEQSREVGTRWHVSVSPR